MKSESSWRERSRNARNWLCFSASPWLVRAASHCMLLRCSLLPMVSMPVMALVTMEECMSLVSSKETRIGPIFSFKARSVLSFILTNHIQSPPFLLYIYNDISLSVYSNNTIYRYYSRALGSYAFSWKIGRCFVVVPILK